MDTIKSKVSELATSLSPRWTELSDRIHGNPEIGFEEFKASKWLSDAFTDLGFTSQLGVGDIPTAFKATLDSGRPGPSVGLIIEYDALEGLGHACAHNTKGPAVLCGVEAFLKAYPSFSGKIVAFGCPAEETGGGKILMADEGVFDGVDLCIELAVGPQFATGLRLFVLQQLTLTFTGKAAHAGIKHQQGVNALEALLFVLNNMEYLKKHLGGRGLMSAVIPDGGELPSIMPAKAVAKINARTVTRKQLREYVGHIETLANLSAAVSGAQVKVDKGLMYLNSVKCPSLARMVMSNIEAAGIEGKFCLDQEPWACSDVGNVSHVVPTETIVAGLGLGLIPHTLEYLHAAGGEPGHNVVLNGGRVLAMCLVDLMAKDSTDLVQRAKEEYAAAKREEH